MPKQLSPSIIYRAHSTASTDFEKQERSEDIDLRDKSKLLEAGISFAVDDSDLQNTIQIITKLMPDRSFCFLNERLLSRQAQRFQELYLPDDPRQAIAYAVKANPRARILEIFGQAGLSFADCSSPGEIEQVKKHWPQATPLYTYPSKFPYEIRYALDQGVRYFTVEDEAEIIKILQEAKAKNIPEEDIEIAIRVASDNPDADINLSEKFGGELSNTRHLINYVREQTKAQLGLSINTGSQNRSPSSYLKALTVLTELAQHARGVSSLNLGGGFPVNYAPEDEFSLEEYLVTLSLALRGIASDLLIGPEPKLIIEPGRALVAEAIDLVIPIRNRKRKDGQEVLLIDDGIYTCFRDAIIHGWKYHFKGFGKANRKLEGVKAEFKISGRTCDNGDKLLQTALLSKDIRTSDYLRVRNAGAYTDSTASIDFNGFKKPKYVTYNL